MTAAACFEMLATCGLPVRDVPLMLTVFADPYHTGGRERGVVTV